MENVLSKKYEAKSKKEKILSLYNSGVRDVEVISAVANARPSYVGSVLQREGLVDNYFDLYTSTGHAMNVYSKYFQRKLGFKDVATAERSVNVLENGFQYFSSIHDRAGQHHALELGLTMLDRARWSGKLEEGEVYRRWLVGKLSVPLVRAPRPEALSAAAADIPRKDEETGTQIKKAA